MNARLHHTPQRSGGTRFLLDDIQFLVFKPMRLKFIPRDYFHPHGLQFLHRHWLLQSQFWFHISTALSPGPHHLECLSR